jgi:hypothetical protein
LKNTVAVLKYATLTIIIKKIGSLYAENIGSLGAYLKLKAD